MFKKVTFIFSQNPSIWVPLDYSRPRKSKWEILSWPGTPRTLRTLTCGGHFVFFVPNPYNMGVYGLPGTPTVKIWHFELTQDHLDTDDTKGMRSGGPFVFCSQPLQYECLRTPWTPTVKIWHLEQACFLTFSKKLKPKKTQGSKKLKETSAQNSIIIFLWIFVLKIAKKPQHTCWNLNFLPKEGLLTRKKYAAL